MAISVGSVSVSVVPDASNFAKDMRAKLSNLPSVQVTVDAVTTQARAAIDNLRGNDITVNVNADTAAARAEIDAAARNRDATINVHADTGGAAAEIAAVGAAASSSGGGVNGLLVAGAALGPAIIPVAGAVAAALAAIGPAALAGVAGIGTLALGFSGIGAAVKALGAQNDGAAAAAAKSASTQVNAAAAIQSAEASLANARAAAGDSAVRAAAAVRDAQRGVADATREAAAGVMSALQGQEQAERSLSSAQASQRQAQLDLTQARMDAKQALEDLAFQVQDGELSQRQANLSVAQAQQNMFAVQADPKATELQRQQAQLAYDQAVQNLNEITVKNQRLKAEKAAADKAGVDGSKQVTSAQQKLNDATQATVDAQKAVKDAYAATAEARRAGAEKVAVAEERVTAATQAQAAAARQSAFSVAQAEASLAAAHRSAAAGAATATAAQTALDKAMGDLSPAGQRFAKFIFGLKGAFDQLKTSAQENLLPGVEAGIRSMLPLLPVLNTIVSNAAAAMGGLFREAGKALTAPFWKSFFKFIADTVGPNLKAFGSIIGSLATGFAGLVLAFQPVAKQVTAGIVSLAKAFADWATHLGKSPAFQEFLQYIMTQGPTVVQTFADLALAAIPLLKALAPFGGVVLGVVDALASFIAQQSPLAALGIVIGGIAVGMAIFGAAAGAIVLAVAGVVAGLAYAYQHFDSFRSVVDTVAKTVKTAWDEHIFPALQSFWKFIVDKLVPALVHFWQDTVVPAFKAIVAAVQYAWNNYLQPIFSALWNFVVQVLVPAVKHLWQDIMVPAWNAISKAVQKAWQMIQPALKVFDSFMRNILIPIIRTLINDVAIPLFKALGVGIKVVWENVIHPALKALGDIIGWLWKTVIKPTLKFIVEAWVTGMGTLLSAADSAFGWIPGIGDKLHTAKKHFDDFAKDVTDALNGIDGQNVEVGVKFKAGDSVALKNTQNKINAGGAGPNTQNRAAGGPIFGPGTGTSDSIPAMLSNGEHVLTAREVEAAGGHAAIYAFRKQLRGFATGGAVTVGTSIPSTASMGSAVDLGFLQFFSDNMKKITDGLVQPFDGSKGAAQWASLVSRVLTELHQPLSDMAAVLRRIDFESGGNPNAINLTDSNAKAGHPSQGLMQTIPTTFSAYAGPYRGLGITNPLANIFAGVNYALHTYGDLANIDPLNRPKGYDAGGWLQPGLTTVFNGTQKPEAVFTHEQFQSIKDGGLGGKGGASVVYNGDVLTVDPDAWARKQTDRLNDAIAVENLTGAL